MPALNFLMYGCIFYVLCSRASRSMRSVMLSGVPCCSVLTGIRSVFCDCNIAHY